METMMGRFLETLGRNSIEAGVLVVVVLVAQWIFGKRIAPRWRCALWLLVMARLLLPVSPGSMVSLFNLFPRLGTTPPEMASRPAPREASPSVVQNTLVVPILNPAPREAPLAVADNLNRRNYRYADNRNYLDGDLESSIYFNESRDRNDKNLMYLADPQDKRIGSMISDNAMVYKGASWKDMAYWVSPGSRRYLEKDQSTDFIGFRCAMTRVGSPIKSTK